MKTRQPQNGRSTASRVVIWTAVSSEEQAKDDKVSLEQQEQAGRAWAAAQGGTVVAHLSVPGHSRSEVDLIDALDELRRNGVTAYDDLRALWKERAFDVLWAYSHSRLGRARTILSHVIDNVIKSGATIFLEHGGIIDRHNKDMQLAMGNMTAVTDLERFVESSRAGKAARAARGLPIGAHHPLSHRVIRDEKGKGVALVPDESKRRLIEDAARLIVEGVPYFKLSETLYERFGHGMDGRPYAHSTFYELFHNPYFWGNGAFNYRNPKLRGAGVGLWVFDEDVPLPEGVEVWRGTHPPALTGELAEALKAAMRYRAQEMRGQMRPYRSSVFAQLLVCGYCGHSMVLDSSRAYTPAGAVYRCHSQSKRYYESRCTKYRAIRLSTARATIDSFLRTMWERNTPHIFEPPASDSQRRIEDIRRDIRQVEEQSRRLIMKQASAPESLAMLYDEQLAALGQQLARLKDVLRDEQHQAARRNVKDMDDAYAELCRLNSVDVFWEQPETYINKLLHRLMGDRRFVVLDGEIKHTAAKQPIKRPPRRR